MRFENLSTPERDMPVADVQIAGLRFDLHQKFRFIGYTYAAEQDEATMGWGAVEPMQVIRGAQSLPVEGLVFHFSALKRFEAAFERSAGALEYFEFRHDPEPMLVFFFEGGTIRLSAAVCRCELMLTGEDDDDDIPDPDSPAPIVQ